MQVKSFEAHSMKDAIKAVKAEFGSDAVILKTEEKMGTYGKSILITASPSGASFRTGGSYSSESLISKEDLISFQRGINELSKRISQLESEVLRRDSLDSLSSDMYEIRSLLNEALQSKLDVRYKNLSSIVVDVVQRLQLMDVCEAQLIKLSKYLSDFLKSHEKKDSSELANLVKTEAIRWMMKRIKVAPKWEMVIGERQVHAFVGASGVGKSSIVAKLAARFFLKEEKNVLIISYDNQRLGSSEQMRIFSKVIGVPFEAISKIDELSSVLSKHKDKELILLDTAGVSSKSEAYIENFIDLSKFEIPCQFHLVASATDKSQQIDRMIKRFNRLGLQSLVFSKLDESWSYGEIFNASLKWGVPLSFFGIGPGVPEDLERASRERVVERIFGL